MSTANPFRRPSNRQSPLIAEAFIDVTDLLKGAPVVTSATAKAGVSEAGDVNSDGIKAGTGSSLSGIAFNLFELPAGAIVLGGDIKVLTAFNSGTSDVISIGDSGSATRYASSQSIASAARTALTVPARQTASTEKVLATWTGVGTAPTAGLAHISLQYIIPGRAVENQGV
jgi:hypothetical protein